MPSRYQPFGAIWTAFGQSLNAIRMRPLLSGMTVAVLALGIGANSAVFSVFSALLLRELPVPEPQRLAAISVTYRGRSDVPLSYPLFEALQENQRAFSALFGWSGIVSVTVGADDILIPAGMRAVSGNYYSELGVNPTLGRLFTPLDDQPGAERVAVISHRFWTERFGADPRVLDSVVQVEGEGFRIVGVAAKWFAGMTPGVVADVTVPASVSSFDRESRSALWIYAAGRLSAASAQLARDQLLTSWQDVLQRALPAGSEGERRHSFLAMQLDVVPAGSGVNPELRSSLSQPLYVVMGVAALIFLIVCLNLASFGLARAASRSREMRVRAALGASPWQLLWAGLGESVIVASVGGLLALVVAYVGAEMLTRLLAEDAVSPILLDVRPDWRTYAFTGVAAVVSGVLVGLIPAAHASRRNPARLVRDQGNSLGHSTVLAGKALVAIQIALAAILVYGAGLFVSTLVALSSADYGFDESRLVEMSLYPQPRGSGSQGFGGYLDDILVAVESVPGVQGAAWSNLSVPAGQRGYNDLATSQGLGEPVTAAATLVAVSPGYFRTLGLPLLAGRDFDWKDDVDSPHVVIVDSVLAEMLGLRVGSRVGFGAHPDFQELEVVGIARAARTIDPRRDSQALFVPVAQHLRFSRRGNLFVRTAGSFGVGTAVEEVVSSAGWEYVATVSTAESVIANSLGRERATAVLSTGFAVLALSVTVLGVFGIISLSVGRRTRDFGVRMALGANRSDIWRSVVGEAVGLTAVGIAVGLAIAFALARFVEGLLYGLEPVSPSHLAGTAVLMCLVGAVAAWLPALRATRLEPTDVLRHD